MMNLKKNNQLKPRPNNRLWDLKTSFIFYLLLCLFTSFSLSFAESDYEFKDNYGNTVVFPAQSIVNLDKLRKPSKEAIAHTPAVKSRIKKEGLHLLRVLEISLPNFDSKQDTIQAIYVLDKDNLIVGYHSFKKKPYNPDSEIEVEFDGIINRVAVYVECSEHGLWGKGVQF